jgi:anti-sigma regulatory factor (Ser/Thr protein kinase)
VFTALPTQMKVPTRTLIDATVAASIAVRFAARAGFTPRTCTEIGIVARELATNVVYHARGAGHLELAETDDGIRLTCRDQGPGDIDRVRRAISGDRSPPVPAATRRPSPGLGHGLGAVRRLMDEVAVAERIGGGLEIDVRRRLPRWIARR